MKLESEIKSKMAEYLRGQGYLVISLFNNPGWPDLECNGFNNTHFFVEVKRPGKAPEPLQVYIHKLLKSRGHIVIVATTLKELKDEFIKVRKRLH